ncbi:sensor histidine kinase [Desulfonatronovibrio hydrogenovorans]|uniref:sensor histidine kinase n=1 Tax=Desulfonatronovibrio hydrogenovorans TaxID=53245 RepID=UPI000691899D|nr:ATP-binding protein [Desulfonatronovibrio hydrogenovorans]
MSENLQQLKSYIPSRTALAYIIIAGCWIAFSDYFVAVLFDDPEIITRMQTYKGWFFVLITGLLLYLALRSQVLVLEKKSLALVEKEKEFYTQLEQRVKQRTAQLEAANHELDAFSYSVSHDLRAPLRSIDGFSQALLEDCHDQLDEQGRDYLHRVRRASQRMGWLIDDLLKLSRVSRAELKVSLVDLSRTAETIIENMVERHPDRKVTANVQPGLKVSGDQALLRVALENLLDNAWKFTTRTGEPAIDLGSTTRDGEQVFFVRDNGAGFDTTYADKLFTPFQRLHSPEDYPGTGIGLATVARIIRKHGGRIWAESEPDQGAVFYFTLPDPDQPPFKTREDGYA